MNKPIAWTDGMGNYFDKNSFFPVDDLIPLYINKLDLTDKEILDSFNPKCDVEIEDRELLEFARAILRKAQEK